MTTEENKNINKTTIFSENKISHSITKTLIQQLLIINQAATALKKIKLLLTIIEFFLKIFLCNRT